MPVVIPGTPGTPVAKSLAATVLVTYAAPGSGDPVDTYNISRSIDGGAFAAYDTSVTTSYTDLVPIIGSVLNYKVSATNAGGTSAFSAASNNAFIPAFYGAGEIHGEVHSADASLGQTLLTYYDGERQRDIKSIELLMVTDFNVVSVPGGVVSISAVDNVATPTKTVILFKGTVVANGGASKRLTTPFQVPHGFTLVVSAPAGVVDVQIQGFVIH